MQKIDISGAAEHNLKNIDLTIERNAITVVSGVSGAGKSTLVLDVILREAQRRFFDTMSLYVRKHLQVFVKPKVRAISGLSPALVLPQTVTSPSPTDTVGSVTGISDLWRVLFVSMGTKKCPQHNIPTGGKTAIGIKDDLLSRHREETIILAASLPDETRDWAKLQKKYLRVIIDGVMYPLDDITKLPAGKERSVVIDVVKVKPESAGRLQRSVNQCILVGKGHGKVFRNANNLQLVSYFSTKDSCPVCGFSWPELDVRHFSENSLGGCENCQGKGYVDDKKCNACAGLGLRKELQAITIASKSLVEIICMSIGELQKLVVDLLSKAGNKRHLRTVLKRIRDELLNLQEVGLDDLTLARQLLTLSSGEQQKIRIATLINESLNGVIYIFDEPSQGLAMSEVNKLWQKFVFLKKQGNTVIIVDHNRAILENADWIIDLGPGGGSQGGRVQAKFNLTNCARFQKQSETARFLQTKTFPTQKKKSAPQFLQVIEPKINNLCIDRVKFLKGAINVVTGVAGAGKSSLVEKCLYLSLKKQHSRTITTLAGCQAIEGGESIRSISFVDRSPLPKRQKSMVINQLDIFSWLRKLFGQLKESQIAGFQAKDFSLSAKGGRCKYCQGLGVIEASLSYLPDTPCYVCHGRRYGAEITQITYRGLSICDVLELTISEATEFFRNFTKITAVMRLASELGLDYLKLGQKTSELSGGESQRLKLVPFVAKTRKDSLLILDEPSSGLHFRDIALLNKTLQKLSQTGITVVLIDHSWEVISQCMWLIELGPGSGRYGGRLLYQGHPCGLATSKTSVLKDFGFFAS